MRTKNSARVPYGESGILCKSGGTNTGEIFTHRVKMCFRVGRKAFPIEQMSTAIFSRRPLTSTFAKTFRIERR
jgi:hypothetical protein